MPPCAWKRAGIPSLAKYPLIVNSDLVQAPNISNISQKIRRLVENKACLPVRQQLVPAWYNRVGLEYHRGVGLREWRGCVVGGAVRHVAVMDGKQSAPKVDLALGAGMLCDWSRRYSGFIVLYTWVTSSSSSSSSVSLSRVTRCSGVTSFKSTLGRRSKPPDMSSKLLSSMYFWMAPYAS